jgi:protein SCO1/2
MRLCTVFLVCAVAAGCARRETTKEYELRGQVLAVDASRNELTIKHEDIDNFMAGMTMPFTVRDASLMQRQKPGDLVTATLVVADSGNAYLSAITTIGHAAVEAPPAVGETPRILVPGDQVADALLVDQDGKPFPFSSLRGHRVALTFIYTRCPLPQFCPMMDRHFAVIQRTLAGMPSLADVRLVSVTLDPEFDTPAVLKAHAQRLSANPAVWTFATGEREEVARFASQLGLYVERNPDNDIDITHNLVTVVVDPAGRLVERRTGNDWTPAELVAELTAAPDPAN